MLRSEKDPAPSPASRWLKSTDWLAERLRDHDVIVVDGSYFLPTQKRDAHAEYRSGHVPGAVFFDIEAVSDHSTELPHMLPGPTQFGEAAGALGIGDGDTVVVYDSTGLFSAARVWWTFRIFGAKNVFILDGGLPKWKAEGRPLETGDVKRTPKHFHAEMNVGAVAMLADVRMALVDDSAQVVDARSAERFAGKAPEPRPGLRSGHMPRSFNVPYERLLQERPARVARADRSSVQDGRGRPGKADHHVLRLRRDGRDPDVRARVARQDAAGPLRRVVGGMGFASRPRGRTQLGLRWRAPDRLHW